MVASSKGKKKWQEYLKQQRSTDFDWRIALSDPLLGKDWPMMMVRLLLD
jgi:hypothetical protein